MDEKEINSILSKVGIPYFGLEDLVIIDVPEKHWKLENPERINELEQTIKELKIESLSNESKLPLQSKDTEVKKPQTT
ncbi:hypothetical protein HK100_010182 [Physocladia obscura]|uniref:Uncharacterized protein n=1 Tax=Physocladia obscura TaxID=109957 RepID=A0AAD5T3V7_9FUNG|nr:hypothetical protein HK100_010182 [Physocladia obscura]